MKRQKGINKEIEKIKAIEVRDKIIDKERSRNDEAR